MASHSVASVMSYELRVQSTPGYLHVQVTGANTPEVVSSYVQEVLKLCASRRSRALLVEENLAGPGLPLAEIYHIITNGSEFPLAHQLTVAFVNVNTEHPPGNVAFAETVARNRGINLRAFRTVKLAQSWLCEVAGTPAGR